MSRRRTPDEPPSTDDAMRLGWTLAEVRGLCDPLGPRPESAPLPASPREVLPLRSQRSASAARSACAGAAGDLAEAVGLDQASEFAAGVRRAITSEAEAWPASRRFFYDWDERIQDELTRRDEQLANAYLLGRGLAECYWAMGPDDQWADGETTTGCAPAYLLGPDRRRELTRMLGRLRAGEAHSLSPSAVSGSLEAWGLVVADPEWLAVPSMRSSLYEQVRLWYQLMVLRQDPTTMVRPYARLKGRAQLWRNLRVLWPQLVLGILAVGLGSWLVTTIGDGDTLPGWLQPVLVTGSAGAALVGGFVGRARNAAQLWATRMRQDVYTDLVSADVTVLPALPHGPKAKRSRQRRALVEAAVRRRVLTPSTPVPLEKT